MQPKGLETQKVAKKYGNMHSFVKIHAENSVMKKMSPKKSYTPEFYGYMMDHNFYNTQGISMKFGRYLKEDMMHL